jgi:WhiB family redox-sensing transcriptional regulator
MFDVTNAACKDMPTDLFFPEGGKSKSTVVAKEVCSTCQISVQCLQWALANNEFGIWGGTTHEERLQLRRGRSTLVKKKLNLTIKSTANKKLIVSKNTDE